MKPIILSLILSVFFYMFSCEESDPVNALNGIDLGVIYRDTLTATDAKFIEYGKISTGSSVKLLLGNYNNYECRFLVKFVSFPADTIELDSVYFLIESANNIGEGNNNINGEIKLVTKTWDTNVNTDEDFSYLNDVSNDPATTTQFNVLPDDSFGYSIPIPDTLISIWKDTTNGDQNHGLLFDYTAADYVKIFNSVNSGILPKLVYVYQNAAQDSTIRDTVFAAFDASLIEYTGNLQSDSLLYITSGFSHRAFIEFDLEKLPKNILLSHANLILKQDTIHSIIDSTSSNNFYVRTVTTPMDELPSYNVDSTFTTSILFNISLSQTSDHLLQISTSSRGETGKYFIQSIVNQDIQYGSFLVHYVGEGITISQYAVKGVNNISEENRPKLILEYYKIPDSRI